MPHHEDAVAASTPFRDKAFGCIFRKPPTLSAPPPASARKPFRSAIQLEEALTSLKDVAITGEKQAAALASGEDEHPESNLAALRARHQVCHVDTKSLLGVMSLQWQCLLWYIPPT